MDLADFEKKANEVADILRALANERRLMILCKLVEYGETDQIFTNPQVARTKDYITGRYG